MNVEKPTISEFSTICSQLKRYVLETGRQHQVKDTIAFIGRKDGWGFY
jgi:hypothetical protein